MDVMTSLILGALEHEEEEEEKKKECSSLWTNIINTAVPLQCHQSNYSHTKHVNHFKCHHNHGLSVKE
jgi:hypothetical protein